MGKILVSFTDYCWANLMLIDDEQFLKQVVALVSKRFAGEPKDRITLAIDPKRKTQFKKLCQRTGVRPWEVLQQLIDLMVSYEESVAKPRRTRKATDPNK